MKKTACILLTLCLALCVAGAALAQEGPYDAELDRLGGETLRLSDYRGKVLILSMWATWCPGCIDEMPVLETIQNEYPGEAAVLAVNAGEYEQDVAAFMEEAGYTFDVALDPEGVMLMDTFPSDYIPYLVVLDGRGYKVFDQVGSNKGLHDKLAEVIKANSPFLSDKASPLGEAAEGDMVTCKGAVAEVTEGGFTLTLEDGTAVICLFDGPAPEAGSQAEVGGIYSGEGIEVTGIR